MANPSMMIVGSLVGVSKKDALAIARGLAERLFDAPKASHVRLKKYNELMVYEIQECNDVSYLDPVLEKLDQGEDAWIGLTANRVAQVSDDGGELITVIHAADKVPEAKDQLIQLGDDAKKMTPFLGDAREMAVAGKIVSMAGAFLFLAAVGIAGITNALTPEILQPQVNHVLPTEFLTNQKMASNQFVQSLEFRGGEFRLNVGEVAPIFVDGSTPGVIAETDQGSGGSQGGSH